MLPCLELDKEQERASEDAAVSVEFRGPFNGRLEIRICGVILPVFGANMLGEDGDLPEEEQLDVLREIANVVCGNMLPEIGGPKAVFHIEPPYLCQIGQRALGHRESPAAEARIGLEQGRAELFLYLDGDGVIEGNRL